MQRRRSTRARFQGWLGASVLALAACRGPEPRPASPAPEAPARRVSVVEVVTSGSPAMRSLPATVQARRRAALAARISATVRELPFREGERVSAGDVVVRLDDAALRSGVAAAQVALQAAAAERTRTEALLERGAATPREREDAAARAAAAEAALAQLMDDLAYAALRAPFSGSVAARPARVGDVVAPGVTLIEIEGDAGFELRASVEPELAVAARPGLELQALVDGQREPLPATLRSVASAADPATHRFEVKADLSAASGLRSGLFARLAWPESSQAPRLLVPTTALFQRGGLNGLFVVADGKAGLRWVAIGRADGGLTEVRAGLEAGERIARDPAGLTDGAAVVETR